MEPLYRVDIHEKTLIADGIATTKVSRENTKTAVSLIPLVYIWWAQTSEPATAMAIEETTIALYPNMDFLENTGMISDITPIPGRILI